MQGDVPLAGTPTGEVTEAVAVLILPALLVFCFFLGVSMPSAR